jgi:hypothetical protein
MGAKIGEAVFQRVDLAGMLTNFQEMMGAISPAVIETVVAVFERLKAVAEGVFVVLRAGWDAVRPSIESFIGPLDNTAESLDRIKNRTIEVLSTIRHHVTNVLMAIVQMIHNAVDSILTSPGVRAFFILGPGKDIAKTLGIDVKGKWSAGGYDPIASVRDAWQKFMQNVLNGIQNASDKLRGG